MSLRYRLMSGRSIPLCISLYVGSAMNCRWRRLMKKWMLSHVLPLRRTAAAVKILPTGCLPMQVWKSHLQSCPHTRYLHSLTWCPPLTLSNLIHAQHDKKGISVHTEAYSTDSQIWWISSPYSGLSQVHLPSFNQRILQTVCTHLHSTHIIIKKIFLARHITCRLYK